MTEEAKKISDEYIALNGGDSFRALIALATDAVLQISSLEAKIAHYYNGCSKAYLREKAVDCGPFRIDSPPAPITDDWIRTGAEA